MGASKAVLLFVSFSAILVIGGGVVFRLVGGGAHAICLPPIPRMLAAVPLPWVKFFPMLLCSGI